jgi:hypothetical protein
LNRVKWETILFETSDHWPTVVTTHSVFPQVNWTAYQAMLVLVEDFWIRELGQQSFDQWYQIYVRFLAALKNRLNTWKEVEKYRSAYYLIL